MDELRIREARPQDVDRLLEVYHRAYRENRELGFPAKAETATGDDVRDWMEEGTLWVSVADGRVVGGVKVERTSPERAKLSRLAVHDAWQGQGIATALLDHVEERARDEGADVIWLTTPPDHPYLPDLYRRRGYAEAGDYPLDYRAYDEIVMEKPLDATAARRDDG